MRAMPEGAADVLTGSRSGDGLRVVSWYDGSVTNGGEPLPVESWSMDWDASRQVQGQLSVEVSDTDGRLAPWAVEDALGVGGSRLQTIYTLGGPGGFTIDMGWWRVAASSPAENWRVYGDGSAPRFVSGGARVPLDADDLVREVVMDRFLAPSSPKSGATVLSEVRRLLADAMPVTVAAGVVDAAVPTSVVYERERMDAVEDLLARIQCTYRTTGDGQLEVVPVAAQAPVWTVAGGDGGALVSVQRSQALEGLYNAAVAEGSTDDGRELVGRALEPTGPLRYGGPHGRYPVFQSSTGLLKTQQAVDSAAATLLAGQVSSRSVELRVTCLPHPGLQLWDWVTVASPVVSGGAVPLVGQVVRVRMSGNARGVDPMVIGVRCAYQDVQVVSELIRRAS